MKQVTQLLVISSQPLGFIGRGSWFIFSFVSLSTQKEQWFLPSALHMYMVPFHMFSNKQISSCNSVILSKKQHWRIHSSNQSSKPQTATATLLWLLCIARFSEPHASPPSQQFLDARGLMCHTLFCLPPQPKETPKLSFRLWSTQLQEDLLTKQSLHSDFCTFIFQITYHSSTLSAIHCNRTTYQWRHLILQLQTSTW